MLIIVVLMDFIFVSTDQKNYIIQKTNDCLGIALSVENTLAVSPQKDSLLSLAPTARRYLKGLSRIDEISSIVIAVADGSSLVLDNTLDSNVRLLKQLDGKARQTLLSGNKATCLFGKTWGVFFIQNRFLIVTTPIRLKDSQIPAAVSCAVDLEPFYTLQRKNQMVVLFYTAINMLLLVFLGTYAISRATIRPINSLVKRAEERQEYNSLDFIYPQGRNEFRRLSTSLNRMLDRIETDKLRLKDSLVDLEEANKEIKARQNELIRAEKLASVGRLSAGIAHEIGNPIGIVLGYLDMLGHQNLSRTEAEDYINRCQKEIQKINTIIRELLDFSRPSNQKEPETVSVHALIKETMDLLAVQPVMRNVSQKYDLDAARDYVSAYPDKLRQVFVNLVLNAADALSTNPPENSEIIIRSGITTDAIQKEEWLRVEISDNGVGIRQTDLETIFDPFYTTKEPGHGTGLGLYVCYMIIDNMGGTMNVDSSPGEGTTFSVMFPLVKDNFQTKDDANE